MVVTIAEIVPLECQAQYNLKSVRVQQVRKVSCISATSHTAGGRLVLNAGHSSVRGGSVSFVSGTGSSTTSGHSKDCPASAGTSGVSGLLTSRTGTSSSGSSSIAMSTGSSSNNGVAGTISVVIGSGNEGNGGRIVVSSGESGDSVGGSALRSSGVSTSSSGSFSISTADSVRREAVRV